MANFSEVGSGRFDLSGDQTDVPGPAGFVGMAFIFLVLVAVFG